MEWPNKPEDRREHTDRKETHTYTHTYTHIYTNIRKHIHTHIQHLPNTT
jgi:S-formylglutathione hydrolase FrmB